MQSITSTRQPLSKLFTGVNLSVQYCFFGERFEYLPTPFLYYFLIGTSFPASPSVSLYSFRACPPMYRLPLMSFPTEDSAKSQWVANTLLLIIFPVSLLIAS